MRERRRGPKDAISGWAQADAAAIEAYFKRKVKPHLLDAWIDANKTKTGYEIN